MFERNEIMDLIPADKKRIPGWDAVHKYLRPDPETGKPRLVIFTNCPNMIRTIPLAMHPPLDSDKDPQDVMAFWDGAEHLDALDELRYVLQTLREQVAPKKLSAAEKRFMEFKKMDEGIMDYSYRRKL